MSDRIKALEDVVRAAVKPAVAGARVQSVTVVPDDDETLRVTVEVAKAKDQLPADVLLRIVNAASDAISEAGEDRFPIVFGRFAATQEFATA